MKNKEFWITNISNKNVSLSDLNITIPAKSSVNLLSKHYKFTEEQLNKSYESGSLFAKRDKLYKRQVTPEPILRNIIVESKYISSQVRGKSVLDAITYEIEDLIKINDNTTDRDKEFQEIADMVKDLDIDK